MVVLTSLTACGAQHGRNVMNEWYISNVTMPGVKDYDPPNGDWIFIRNEPGGSKPWSPTPGASMTKRTTFT